MKPSNQVSGVQHYLCETSIFVLNWTSANCGIQILRSCKRFVNQAPMKPSTAVCDDIFAKNKSRNFWNLLEISF